MAVTPNSIVTPQSLSTTGIQFTDANGTVAQTIASGGTNGCIVRRVAATSSDSAARYLTLTVTPSGGSERIVGKITLPITAGRHATNATPSVNVLNSTDLPWLMMDTCGNMCLPLGPGDVVKAVLDANCTAGLTVDVVTVQENF